MSDSSMSPEAKTLLGEVGWYEGRQISESVLTEWTTELSKCGLKPFAAAMDVLREFGGLRIRPRVRLDAKFMVGEIVFDPVLAGVGEQDRVEDWIEFFGPLAYPIGEAEGHMLIIDENKTIYWRGPSIDYVVGDDIYEAMDALLLRARQLVQAKSYWDADRVKSYWDANA